MPQSQAPLSKQIHAAFGWWQGAGVDLDFEDDVTDWLAQEEPVTPTKSKQVLTQAPQSDAPETPKKSVNLLGENPPQDLKDFQQWWLGEPALDKVGIRGRIPPQGQTQADLMVLVMTPEEGDSQSLLAGQQGRLLDGFLRAAGIDRQNIYLASALPRYTPMADGTSLISSGYGDVLRHHIKLVDPKRLLILGRRILPLLGHEATQELAHLQNINHENHMVPLLVVEGLDSMLAMPRLKAKFWRKWLDWTEG